MTRFILVRHGQTAWNREERFRGRKDIPLSEEGRREAEATAEALADEGIDQIYASPLSRAMETLAPLARRLNREVVPFPELTDMNFGAWEGLTLPEAKSSSPDLFAAWKERPETVTFPGGESLAEVQARAMRAISRLAVEFPGRTVAVCSHRVVCKLILLGLLGLKPDKFWAILQDTACLNRFEYDPPQSVLMSLNDTHHLRHLGGRLKKDF